MFSENLKQARKKSGLSQEELASEVHVTRQAVAKWESGENEPSLASVNQLAQILQVSVAYLVSGEEPTPLTSKERVSHFFRWGNLLKISALLLGATAIGLLALPAVTNYDARAYSVIFGTDNHSINPLALIAWLFLSLSVLSLLCFFFIDPDKKIKKYLFWFALGGFAISGVLFLSCQCLNPEAMAGPSSNYLETGYAGIGESFPASNLDQVARDIMVASLGEENVTPELIAIEKSNLLNRYWLIGDTYYFVGSRSFALATYSQKTNLGAGFLSSGILCLAASLLGLSTFWIKNKPIHLSSEISSPAVSPKNK